MVKLYHYTNDANVEKILEEGLVPVSKYERFSKLRENVVFCWISPQDQKLFDNSAVCLEVEVEEERCIVADMDYISMAMMHKYGGKQYGAKNIPVNTDAAELFVKIYETTAKAFSECEKDNFFTPEVLVKGRIDPERIRIYQADHQSESEERIP